MFLFLHYFSHFMPLLLINVQYSMKYSIFAEKVKWAWQYSHLPHGCCDAEWRHMAGYVSSYPTQWSVADMPRLSGQKESRAKKEGREKENEEKWLDCDHTSATVSVIPAHLRFTRPEKVNVIVIHLGKYSSLGSKGRHESTKSSHHLLMNKGIQWVE